VKVYLDYNGSSPLDPRVAEVMWPTLINGIGNASSVHRFGRHQAAAVSQAREHIAALVGANASHVLLTASATEANNLVLQGVAQGAPLDRPRILVSAVEHASVLQTARWLSKQGLATVGFIPVTRGGYVDPETVAALVDTDVRLVSVMAANSETGVTNPVAEIAQRVHAVGALFHCDATQYVGRRAFHLTDAQADFVSLSGHKICGPNGVGALIGTRASLRQLQPLIHGGGHEQGLRSGSCNVAGAVGFGEAARIAKEERETEAVRVAGLRDRLVAALADKLSGVHTNGDSARRLPNTANLRFEGANAEAVATNMDPVAVSTGSACSSGSIEPSEVLVAMGVSRAAAFESIRFSLGRFTTDSHIDAAIKATVTAVEYVRVMTQESS